MSRTATLPGYIICTQPRSGSSAICAALRTSKALGNPIERFNRKTATRFLELQANPTDLRSYIRKVIYEPGCHAGVVASKVFWFQLQWITKLLAPQLTLAEAFNCLFEVCGPLKVIRLIRQDKLRQAISYVTASRSGIWRATDSQAAAQMVSPAPTLENLQEINYWYERLQAWEREWDALLIDANAASLTIYYEEIVHDIAKGAEAIAQCVGLDPNRLALLRLRSPLCRLSPAGADDLVAAFQAWRAQRCVDGGHVSARPSRPNARM